MNISKTQTTAQAEAWARFNEFHKGFKNPNVLIMGNSGSGKTRSICNLPPENTKIILTEKSTLTFPNAKSFYNNNSVIDVDTFKDIKKALWKHSLEDKNKYFVVDSFTGLWQLAYKEAKVTNVGFAIWDEFAVQVQDILDFIGNIKQTVFVIAHSEKINAGDTDEEYETEVFIEGRKIKKMPIASRFELCLFAKKHYETEDIVKYNFYTNALRHTSAKSPEGMLPRVIDNDMKIVVEAIENFYK